MIDGAGTWRDPDPCVPRSLEFPKGMLGSDERRALFWYAREVVDGRGHVIDAGAFVGTSSYALACGLAHSRHPNAHRAKVHAYDMFKAFETYTENWVSREFGGQIGTEFRDIFEFQLGRYLDRVVVHEGDLLKQYWTGELVEILFIDVAKSLDLHNHILSQFFPYLVPNHSLVIHQDYFLSRHPWIHAAMELMREHFALLDPYVKWCSRVWRCVSPVPPQTMERIANFSHGEIEQLLKRAQLIEEPGCRELFDLLLIQNDLQWHQTESAARRLAEFVPGGDADQVMMLETERDYLAEWLSTVVSQA
jgi:hypothetical protein